MHRLLLTIACLILAGCGSDGATDSDPANSAYFLAPDAVIEVDGLKIRYRDEGPKSAQVLVMVHGFTSSLESWDGIAQDLSRDFRILRLDLPGHGLTGPDAPSRYTNEDSVRFLTNLLEKLKVSQPVIVGNSLGGLVAWRYAVSNPETVRGLVLIAPGGFSINGVTEDPVSVPPMVQYYLINAPEAGVTQALQTLYGDPTKLAKERIKIFREMMQVPGNGQAFIERAATFTLPDPMHDLTKLQAPTLLLWGRKDVMVPVEHGEKFLALLPNASLKIYDGAGHIPQEEVPQRVAQDIRDFLIGLAP